MHSRLMYSVLEAERILFDNLLTLNIENVT